MTVESTGDVGIGTTNPVTKLDVRGRLVLDDTAGSLIYTAASGGEQSKYLRLINSPDLASASGLMAGGVLVSNDYGYASPGKSDLIVKGNVGIGTASPAARLVVVESGGTGTAASFSQNSLTTTAPTVLINTFSNDNDHYGLNVVSNNGSTAANFLCNDAAGSGDGVVSRVVGSGIAGNFTAEGAGQAILATHSLVDSTVVRLERTADSNANIDVLELRTGAASQDNMQFIECERGADVKFRVWGDGDVSADGAFTGSGADFAEMIQVTDGANNAEPGDVMVIDPTEDRSVRVASTARSTLVAGIYSTKPGYLGSEDDWDDVALQLVGTDPSNPEELVAAKPIDLGRMIGQIPMAVVGIVPCKVSAENGPIKPGDLLVTSGTPGHAMRDNDARAGTIVGKALGSLDQDTGVIKVLVTLQ